MSVRLATRLASVVLGAVVPFSVAVAESVSFTDVPTTHPAFAAIAALQEQGVLQGYPDGTFQPNRIVNRAEAVKIITAPLVLQSVIDKVKTSVYADVPADSWYKGYVEAARTELGILDGPPKTQTFNGERPVKKAEFLKMMLLGNKFDTGAYGELKLPLATDVQDPDAWFYPYLRYSLASSVTMAENGLLQPSKELTRAEVAMFLYRLMMYKDGHRTQVLLSEAEGEIVTILRFIEKNDLTQAEFSASRALLAARGALSSSPNDNIVKAAVKTAEGFQSLVRAYKACAKGDTNEVIRLAGTAWQLAEKARTFSPSLDTLATQMQTIAKNLADEARRLQSTP